ncbi:MAG TPA: hypothetical protein DCM08_02400 [Microscillaceae bacterium]|jgi:putative endonuclease|nr:hypothetical protein [Microscillaceae bacterium]
MAKKLDLGKMGEKQAQVYFESKGYVLLAQNFRAGRAEIDLIFSKDDTLVFVEVKTRSSNFFGEPEAFLTTKQETNIVAGAEAYIEQINWQGVIRFDVVALLWRAATQTWEIDHFEDAFH